MEVEEVAQAEEGEGEADTVDLVKVDDGVCPHGIQCLIDLEKTLLLL